MTPTMPIHRTEVAEIEMLEVADWRTSLVERAKAGMRPLTLYGRREGKDVVVTAV